MRSQRSRRWAAGSAAVSPGRTAADLDLLASLRAGLPWMPLVMAAAALVLLFLAFGSVVLLSRVREEWDRTGDNVGSVAAGCSTPLARIYRRCGIHESPGEVADPVGEPARDGWDQVRDGAPRSALARRGGLPRSPTGRREPR